MNKKIISAAAAAVTVINSLLIPISAFAEAHATYITNSDFTDCAVGGATGTGYYGLGIIMDGSPWLSKGSASRHAETYMHDDARNINYCNFYSNSDKSGTNDGAGSMYIYQRDSTQDFKQDFGYCQFDIKMHNGTVALMLGSFQDATSSTDYLANTITFTENNITMQDGGKVVTTANIKKDTWYTVKISINNILQSVSMSVTDVNTGKVVGMLEDSSYQQSSCNCVRTWCFGYVRGNQYNYDLTNVTVAKATGSQNPYSIK